MKITASVQLCSYQLLCLFPLTLLMLLGNQLLAKDFLGSWHYKISPPFPPFSLLKFCRRKSLITDKILLFRMASFGQPGSTQQSFLTCTVFLWTGREGIGPSYCLGMTFSRRRWVNLSDKEITETMKTAFWDKIKDFHKFSIPQNFGSEHSNRLCLSLLPTRPIFVRVSQVLEIHPEGQADLPIGTRVCAFWSSAYACLFPATITTPDEAMQPGQVLVELDDGDSRPVDINDIRMLPPDYSRVGECLYPLKMIEVHLISSLIIIDKMDR